MQIADPSGECAAFSSDSRRGRLKKHYGRGRREFAFPVGRKLTISLARKSAPEVVSEWLAGLDSGCPVPSLDELGGMDARTGDDLLPRLDEVDLAAADLRAARAIEAVRRAVVYSHAGAELYRSASNQ